MKRDLRSAIRCALRGGLPAVGGAALLLVNVSALSGELPVVCVAGNCGAGGPSQWVTSGSATATATANTLTINQTTDRAVLNWASFNVGADGRVIFNQPDSSSIALNRIFQDSPSQIFGAVEANGQIYLVNPNGFVFGRTARINASGILASTLGIKDSVFKDGLLAPNLLQSSQPALESDGRVNVLDSEGNPVLGDDGKPLEVQLVVEEGARLESKGSGGRVMLASRVIDNSGTISAPDGQALLAAGDKVYLQASSDPALRGLLVEVAAGGEAWNRMTGSIEAARGNVTVAGLAVNQQGRISASTTVSANGSVRLIARDNPTFVEGTGGATNLGPGQNGGTLELGSTSRIEVLPDLSDKDTAVDEEIQLPSRIDLSARAVFMRSGSQIVAPAGELNVAAAGNPSRPDEYDPTARIRVEGGARIDLSGSDVSLPMSRNAVTVELRANELRDSPTQRDGALRGQTVVVDARIGTPLADVSGAIAAIPKSIAERTSQGGTSSFDSQGDIVIASDAQIDVSGGVITYEAGPLQTSRVIGADGRVYDIGEADPDKTYVGVLNPTWRAVNDRWGYVDTTTAPGVGVVQQQFVQGADAGKVQFAAPQMILNGTFTAETVTGPWQRDPGSLPLGGQFVIGRPPKKDFEGVPDYRTPSVTFSLQPDNIVVDDEYPILSQLPLQLQTDYLRRGFTRTAVYSNGRIVVPEDVSLVLAPGSSLALTAQGIDILANITATGGSIQATAGLTTGSGELLPTAGVTIGHGVTLDVRGNWTNDALAAANDPAARPASQVFADGGTISLVTSTPGSVLDIGNEVSLLADAGAWLQRDGTLRAGSGGSIELDGGAEDDGALLIGENITLQAFGVLGGMGGTFSLTAPRFEINSSSGPMQAMVGRDPQQQPSEDPQEETLDNLQIGQSLFSEHGFRSISLTASGRIDAEQDPDALRIAEGTALVAQTRLQYLDPLNLQTANATNASGIASIALPEEALRNPMSLSFGVAPSGASGMRAEQIGRLNLERTASVLADSGSSVAFYGLGGIDIGGSIVASGGLINLTTRTPSSALDEGYRPDLQIRIASGARLDVGGSVSYLPNDGGLRFGSVRDGGAIEMHAQRGSVVVEHGAMLDISGTSATFDFETQQGYESRVVASNGGRLSVVAPESIALNGELRAAAGVGTTGTAHAGELSIKLSREAPFQYGTEQNRETYPTNDRVLRVTDVPIAIGGASGPSGLAVLNTHWLRDSGVDAITLESDGRIEFQATDLQLARWIKLDTPGISLLGGGDVSLQAAYVALSNTTPSRTPPAVAAGTSRFEVRADFIDAIGAVSVSGTDETLLSSAGDIRVRDVIVGTARAGSLTVAGDLTLRGTQLYPATLSQFTLNAAGDASRLLIEQAGPAAAAPLSAGGSLTLAAATIEHNGTLLAPFGSISFDASDWLILGAGSRTSVSGAGALVPFGRVENGEWIYVEGDRVVQDAIPARHVELQAPHIQQSEGASIDVSGGGDLYAYEWIPGTGGSKDALGGSATAGRYAIIPSLRNQFAPYDRQEFTGSDLAPGESVYLSGVPGLEPGFYPLLPARYALLPGAMLVEAVPQTRDMQPGAVATLADGTPVAAGYRTFGMTALGGTQYSGFAVRSGASARQMAQYDDMYASRFFAAASADADSPRPMLPADAGSLSLLPTLSLDMRGSINLSGATGGRAGHLEIAAPEISVVGRATDSGSGIVVATEALDRWRAGEVWIGGRQQPDQVEVLADTVHIGANARLQGEEVVLLARNAIDIEGGATVATTGLASADSMLDDRRIVLTGDSAGAAVAAVSDRHNFDVQRGTITQSATLNTSAGSVVRTRGSLLVDAPQRVTLGGDVDAAGAAWHLASGSVLFDEAVAPQGLTIDRQLLSDLNQARSITLSSLSDIVFNYDVSLGHTGTQSLTLRAEEIRGGTPLAVNVAAQTVRLQGRETSAVPAMVRDAGTLSVTATDILFGDGELTLNGFATTGLRATQDVRGEGESTLRLAGNLDIQAARVTASSGGKATILAPDSIVRISSSGSSTRTSDGVLGGALSIVGNEIDHAGLLYAPSGLISLQAQTRLSIADTAMIDVGGRGVSVAGRTVQANGGTLQLASGGSLAIAAGSLLDVSSEGADAGRIDIHAAGAATLAGTLRGAGGVAGTGGAFDLYAGSLGDFGALNRDLQSGKFTQRQSIRVGSGDMQLAAGERVDAHDVQWIADGGSITVDGVISAVSGSPRSSIGLHGANGVSIRSGAQLRADAGAGSTHGGSIELGSNNGVIGIAEGSVISAQGSTRDGSLRLRAAATGSDVRIDPIGGTITDVASVVIEPVRVFDVSAAPSVAELNAIRADIDSYIAGSGGAIRSRLDPGGALPMSIHPGIELRHDGNLTLGQWDLSAWRFSAAPASVSVRASGSVNINGAISDGFGTVGSGPTARLTLLDGPSATMRFTAGADLASASPTALLHGAAADLTLGNTGIIRSGTGDVRVAAAQDVIFSGAGSAIYTGGIAGSPTQVFTQPAPGWSVSFPDQGGSVSMIAGRDITGAPVRRSVSEWQRRQGTSPGATQDRATYWGVELRQFGWNTGTLGGGDIDIRAGGAITNLSVAAADSAIEQQSGTLTRFGGGSISIAAGGDLSSTQLYSARGTATLRTDGSLGSAGTSGEQLGTLILMGDSIIDIAARQDVLLESIINSTLLAQPSTVFTPASSFATYEERSQVRAVSSGGNVALVAGNNSRLNDYMGPAVTGPNGLAIRILPPSLALQSLSSDVVLTLNDSLMYPSSSGQLDLFAAGSILGGGDSTSLTMSDAPDLSMPTPLQPVGVIGETFLNALTGGGSARHLDDTTPVLLTAGTDIEGILLAVPKRAEIVAGRDISDVSFTGQNLRATDVTRVDAGRDLRYSNSAQTAQLSIGGPGRFDIVAGRDVDLGFSLGVTTVGRLSNPSIADVQGATINLLAGMSRDMNAAGFLEGIILASPDRRDQLLQFMRRTSGDSTMTYENAVKAFRTLDAIAQRPLLLDVFFGELVASGREANSDPDAGFKRGYAAIDALFPDSRSETVTNPYDGDLTLAFSRIYTLAGGDVNLLVPGGSLNVGLANPPPTITSRNQSQLGIVAQRDGNVRIYTHDDVLVNQSRVFTLLGGDIAIWSTLGDIDAGRGAKSSISAPPPAVLVDSSGRVTLDFAGAVAGSGIRTIVTDDTIEPGDVDLIAPAGIVNAGDAGIGTAGNLNIAAEQVVGLDNIQVGGVSTGVPPETSGIAASLSGATAAANSSTQAATSSVESDQAEKGEGQSIAEAALSWLEVFVVGLGDDDCKQDDVECLKRQRVD